MHGPVRDERGGAEPVVSHAARGHRILLVDDTDLAGRQIGQTPGYGDHIRICIERFDVDPSFQRQSVFRDRAAVRDINAAGAQFSQQSLTQDGVSLACLSVDQLNMQDRQVLCDGGYKLRNEPGGDPGGVLVGDILEMLRVRRFPEFRRRYRHNALLADHPPCRIAQFPIQDEFRGPVGVKLLVALASEDVASPVPGAGAGHDIVLD